MKLVSYLDGDRIKAGIVHGEFVIDVSNEFPDTLSIVKEGNKGLEKLSRLIDSQRERVPLGQVSLLSPISQVDRNIICIGWNYLEHFHERSRQDIQLPEKPTIFTKATRTVAGPYEDIPVDQKITKEFDYEAELAVIVGKEGKGISEEDALDYVFGYMVANDLSARDIQQAHGGQWFLGKSIDKSCPMGPWIMTKDEVPDPQNLDISCIVNGEVVQSSNTSYMMFSVARIIAEVSRLMTLLPGDIILTGTPEGVGAKRNPPLFLTPGDIVEVKIAGVGHIRNQIIKA